MAFKKAIVTLSQDQQTLHCAGEWTLYGIESLPLQIPRRVFSTPGPLHIDASKITQLDTGGALRLCQWVRMAEQSGKEIDFIELNARHRLLFELVYSNLPAVYRPVTPSFEKNALDLLGRWSVHKLENGFLFSAFIGEVVVRFFKIRMHGLQNLGLSGLRVIQTAGSQALAIVAMMSFLVGIVLTYQLGVQLQIYGADIYVVDAAGISILREFAPLITSVIVSGRTSTAFAALIGTMKVNDELNALTTMGISVVERLVLPRVLALLIVLPLLVIWSSVFSLLGSLFMAKLQLNIGYGVFLERFKVAVELKHYVLGMVKTPVFALIISTVGCFQGLQSAMSADSVGIKTTAAAVQSISLIIVADAFFSILFSWRGL